MCPLVAGILTFAGCLTAILVVALLISIQRKVKKNMADTSKLTAITAKIQTDVAALLASSANDQPAIDASTAVLTALDTTVLAAIPAAPATPPATS